jgi:uncharacterized protein (TIGR00251 family)
VIELIPDETGVRLPVKVVPGASRTRFQGELDGRAKIAVAAPPEKGKANAALVAYLAGQLGVRRRDVTVIQGTSSPAKTVHLGGVTVEAARAWLDASAGGGGT